MSRSAKIELRDFQLQTKIGTYGPNDVVPDAHILDLSLTIGPDLVLIERDGMALVFDYDPLIAQIDQISQAQHYQTQEYLMTLIVEICATYPQIIAVELCLRKTPVLGGTGNLGVRLVIPADELSNIRSRQILPV
jgi:dihydroneopterin aldolase